MAISVNWVTGEVTVPKADTVLISAGPPEIRLMDVAQLRLDLLDLHASEDGRIWPRVMRHNGEVTLSGFVYVRAIQFIPPYFITVEDGAYVTNLDGANNNVLDVATANSVSLRAQNSGGLLRTDVSGLTPGESTLLTTMAADAELLREVMVGRRVVISVDNQTITFFKDDNTTVAAVLTVSPDGRLRERTV